MAAAEAEARRLGFRRLTIEVEDDNAPARALYQKPGYHDTGPGHAPNELAMTKDLPAREELWTAEQRPV